MWNPGTTSQSAYLPASLPAPAQINPNGFIQNFQAGTQDQVGRNALSARFAAGNALAHGDYGGAKAAAFAGGDTQLGMQLNDYQQQQQLKAFQMLGNVAMLSQGDPDKWKRAVQSVRTAGYNVSPSFDDPTSGPQQAIAMAGMAPQMFAQNQAKQQMAIEQGKFGLEKNAFDFNRGMAIYGHAYNQWIMGGQQGPMPTQAQFGISGSPMPAGAAPAPTGNALATVAPQPTSAAAAPAAGNAPTGNALATVAPQPTSAAAAPAAGNALAMPPQPALPSSSSYGGTPGAATLNYAGPLAGIQGGNALAAPPMAQPLALAAPSAPATDQPPMQPGYQSRAVGLPIPTAQAATGAPTLGDQSMQMVRLGASSSGLSRLLSTLPENQERGAYASSMGKATADIVNKQQAGANILNSLEMLRNLINSTPEQQLLQAIGPHNMNPINGWVPGVGGSTIPEAKAEILGALGVSSKVPSYDLQNELMHLAHGLTTAFITSAGPGMNMSNDRQAEFAETMSAMLHATSKDSALEIAKHAEDLIRNQYFLGPAAGDAPGYGGLGTQGKSLATQPGSPAALPAAARGLTPQDPLGIK